MIEYPLQKVSEKPAGILRLDLNRPRRLSAEFKFQGEPTSPQPSVDRLSVTFAEDSLRSDSSRCNYFSPGSSKMDKVHFPSQPTEEDSDEEDYSASVNAIIQRKASTRRSCRRNSRGASSSFSPDILPGTENGRRRSSVFTTSSGDTAITIDDHAAAEVVQEEIFENIKLHKEVLSNVKMQPWNMRKKLKLVIQAKSYIKKHEGALQERLAQSHSTRDMIASWNIYLIKKWHHFRREMLNLSMWFIPWELKIKQIESHFGSVVASYFIFLRWMFWVNLVIAIVLISFVAIPEMLTADLQSNAYSRKFTLEEEKYNATNFLILWDFEGVLKYSPLFYGWYTTDNSDGRGYKLPLAYFITGLVVYAYSFFATLRKMAENSRMSKLSEKDDECIFSWKLFTAWDYMIGNAETAHNRVASIVMGFKEALLEEAEKKRESRNWKIVCSRVFVNLVVLGLLTFSAYAVVMVVKRSTEKGANDTVWRKNEITIVMSLITLFFPMLFEVIGFLEQYHPRKQLRMQLARIMILNLLNLYSLIFALFEKIGKMKTDWLLFENITCMEPSTGIFNSEELNTPQSTSITYILSNIFNYTQEVNLPESFNLVYDMDYDNDSNVTLFTNESIDIITKIFNELTEINSTAIINTTEFTKDYLVPNITNNFLTETFFNSSFYNETFANFTDNVTDSIDIFMEYFTQAISFFNTSNITEKEVINTTETDDLEVGNEIISTKDVFRNVKSFLLSLFPNISIGHVKETISGGSTTLSDKISTTESYPTNLTPIKYPICETAPTDSTRIAVSTTPSPATKVTTMGNYSMCAKWRMLCWETMFGQELIKLTVMDLIMTILSTLAIDFFRGIFVRVMNRCWCWDLEKTFPQYGDFKVAENILHLVNNQGMVWMGMFFSPGAWAVLTCNVPHEVIFRASRSNNFYYALLLMMLFLCVLPVGYAIVRTSPSKHCGPFSDYSKIFHILTDTIRKSVPENFHGVLDYIASPGIVIPLLVLLVLIIYYLVSLTGALRNSNEDLKIQLRRERREERRKMFQIVDRRRAGSGDSNELSKTPFTKWKKLLGNMPSGKSFDDTPKQQSEDLPQSIKQEKIDKKNKDFLTKFIKKALGKSSTSEEEQNIDDGTDTEQHDSLPYDTMVTKQMHKPVKPSLSWGNSEFSNVVSNVVKANQKKLSSLAYDSIDSGETKPFPLERHGTFEMKRKISEKTLPSTSRQAGRQDSVTSVWSDNIPVITISKTDSAENILMDTSKSTDKQDYESSKFKPKIKCVLKKQSTEFDEDTICYFNRDLEKNLKDKNIIKIASEENFEPVINMPTIEDSAENDVEISVISKTENNSDHSSSEDTEFRECSVDTILNFPKNSEGLLSSEEKTISDDSIDGYS